MTIYHSHALNMILTKSGPGTCSGRISSVAILGDPIRPSHVASWVFFSIVEYVIHTNTKGVRSVRVQHPDLLVGIIYTQHVDKCERGKKKIYALLGGQILIPNRSRKVGKSFLIKLLTYCCACHGDGV